MTPYDQLQRSMCMVLNMLSNQHHRGNKRISSYEEILRHRIVKGALLACVPGTKEDVVWCQITDLR